MLKALVTGGYGFIGANLALELEMQDFQVTLLDRNTSTKQELEHFKGETIQLDVSQPFTLDQKFDVIFHQAALTDPRFEDDEEIFRANVEGFRNILALSRKCGARLVYASTAGLYGNGATPMREDQPKECITAYGRSKLAMDDMAEELLQEMPIVGLRYFNVFGPREAHKGRPASMIYHLSQQMQQGKAPRIFEFGEQQRDHIYVKDVVEANLCALKAPSGVYNVGTGVGTSFNELVDILNEVLGTKFEPEYFEMPYDASTYQHSTIADTELAETQLRFKAKWELKRAVEDYMDYLNKSKAQR